VSIGLIRTRWRIAWHVTRVTVIVLASHLGVGRLRQKQVAFEIFLEFDFDTTRSLRLPFTLTLAMSALFNFESLLLVMLLLVCTCTYLHAQMPAIMDRNKHGYNPHEFVDRRMFGIFWKFARIGERSSPYVSVCCLLMAVCALLDAC
jgi:hypothetical protein